MPLEIFSRTMLALVSPVKPFPFHRSASYSPDGGVPRKEGFCSLRAAAVRQGEEIMDNGITEYTLELTRRPLESILSVLSHNFRVAGFALCIIA